MQIWPVCSVKVTRDMLSHISLQHGHLFKLQRRRRLRRVGSQTLSLLGRDLREAHLQVLLGGSSGGYRLSTTTSSDPFLSSLVLNFPNSEAEEIAKSNLDQTSLKTPQHIWKSRYINTCFPDIEALPT
ncbi:putative protein dehydration-induced 19 [Helianthus annuus]|nr:putative protein dehydration-induced 19 [Helianthus annuus]